MHLHGQVLAAAERAAHPGQREPHLLRRQAERRQICFWSTCSHWVATYRSTPPSSAGTASPDSGPRNAWSCMPTSYSPVDHHVGAGVRVALAELQVPDDVALRVQRGLLPDSSVTSPGTVCTRFHRGWPSASWASVTGSYTS